MCPISTPVARSAQRPVRSGDAAHAVRPRSVPVTLRACSGEGSTGVGGGDRLVARLDDLADRPGGRGVGLLAAHLAGGARHRCGRGRLPGQAHVSTAPIGAVPRMRGPPQRPPSGRPGAAAVQHRRQPARVRTESARGPRTAVSDPPVRARRHRSAPVSTAGRRWPIVRRHSPADRPAGSPSVAGRRPGRSAGARLRRAPGQETRRLDGSPDSNSAPLAGPPTGGRPRRGARARSWSALREQPRGQSNSTGRPSTQPTAAARRQLGQSSQVTRSLGSISLPSRAVCRCARRRGPVLTSAAAGSGGRPRDTTRTRPSASEPGVRTSSSLPPGRATTSAGRPGPSPVLRRSDGSGGR
ncbi:hypothetical protein SAMN05428965_3242 [Geodermatophilus sp. DSM 45219]|nr:hypothetical protein SAMN05428965_3242 [Geodermatophilus sp. DSM 45219]